jgi:hypothetical protein
LLSVHHGVRVIYVTANPAQIGDASATALGVITKPFREKTIREALSAAADEAPDLSTLAISGFTPLGRNFCSSTELVYQD